MHTSNLYYNEPAAEAADKLVRMSGMSRVFFTNSGTEAIEGAIKAARKYALKKDGKTDHEIIAMNHSFHGRSMGALSVTGNEKYQAPTSVRSSAASASHDYNDLEKRGRNMINEKTAPLFWNRSRARAEYAGVKPGYWQRRSEADFPSEHFVTKEGEQFWFPAITAALTAEIR